MDPAVVVDEPELAKLVHEEAHPRAGRADHLGERLLADFGDDRLGFAILAEIRQQQKQPREALLVRPRR